MADILAASGVLNLGATGNISINFGFTPKLFVILGNGL